MTTEGIPQRPHFDPDDLGTPEGISLRLLAFVAIVVVVLVLVITSIGVILIRKTQLENRPVQSDTHYLAGLIKDCVTVGSKCYKNNLAKTADQEHRVDQQNRAVSAATAACGVKLGSSLARMSRHQAFLAVYGCQQQELAKHRQGQ